MAPADRAPDSLGEINRMIARGDIPPGSHVRIAPSYKERASDDDWTVFVNVCRLHSIDYEFAAGQEPLSVTPESEQG